MSLLKKSHRRSSVFPNWEIDEPSLGRDDHIDSDDDGKQDLEEIPGSLSLMFWLESPKTSEPGPATKVHCGLYCKDRYSGEHLTCHLKDYTPHRRIRTRCMIQTEKSSRHAVLLEPLRRVVVSKELLDYQLRKVSRCISEMPATPALSEADPRHCHCYMWTIKVIKDIEKTGALPIAGIDGIVEKAFRDFKTDRAALELTSLAGAVRQVCSTLHVVPPYGSASGRR
ncbi:hypothetical protein BXZ70DRAFT_178119 [Cristinia sonorae]|uniref:Uncharacterized protein n=1 Tax=Cristinia sonorae TaxID=1940300 RepID=A0A8K0UNV4_9AGAR|nr:hypothetical protein BXZ70DRAFT_178119 [Cristinia sonorae]